MLLEEELVPLSNLCKITPQIQGRIEQESFSSH